MNRAVDVLQPGEEISPEMGPDRVLEFVRRVLTCPPDELTELVHRGVRTTLRFERPVSVLRRKSIVGEPDDHPTWSISGQIIRCNTSDRTFLVEEKPGRIWEVTLGILAFGLLSPPREPERIEQELGTERPAARLEPTPGWHIDSSGAPEPGPFRTSPSDTAGLPPEPPNHVGAPHNARAIDVEQAREAHESRGKPDSDVDNPETVKG